MRHVVQTGTRNLAWFEAGPADGRPLVLLHAFPLNAEMWRPQLVAPPGGWRVLAPDLAGFGGTDDHPQEPVSLDDYAVDVLNWLDRLGVQEFAAAGLSMGGYVTLALARLALDRLTALALADTKATADTEEARAGREKMLETLRQHGSEGVADAMLPKLLGETSRRVRPELTGQVRSLILSNAPPGIRRGIIRLRDRPDSTPVLRRLVVPVVILVGEEDAITPMEDARALQAGITGATLEVIPGAGHLSSLEAPQAFNGALSRLLSTL